MYVTHQSLSNLVVYRSGLPWDLSLNLFGTSQSSPWVGEVLGQQTHATTIAALIPPATHRAVCICPVTFDSHPPATAPANMLKKANARRLRLTFAVRGRAISGSDAKSHKTLVTTTVGISLRLRARLPTICPADWKLKNPIAISCFQSISLGIWSNLPSIIPAPTMAAVMSIRRACRTKELTRVVRRSGPRNLLSREKKREPMMKQTIEVKDLTQP